MPTMTNGCAMLGLRPFVGRALARRSRPPLTDERKKELEKAIRKMTEEARIKIRNNRDEANKEVRVLETEKKLSEDAAFKEKERIQKIVDKSNQEIETLLESKLKEIYE